MKNLDEIMEEIGFTLDDLTKYVNIRRMGGYIMSGGEVIDVDILILLCKCKLNNLYRDLFDYVDKNV